MNTTPPRLTMEVLQQFRVIYGSMRHYFRELEESCGLTGAQMWLLQEVESSPELGITELAGRLGIHQSTCSQLVEKLVTNGYLIKKKQSTDQRRVCLLLGEDGKQALAALPGPAEGVLPAALASIPLVALKTLNVNLSELISHLPHMEASYAALPLAEIVND